KKIGPLFSPLLWPIFLISRRGSHACHPSTAEKRSAPGRLVSVSLTGWCGHPCRESPYLDSARHIPGDQGPGRDPAVAADLQVLQYRGPHPHVDAIADLDATSDVG